MVRVRGCGSLWVWVCGGCNGDAGGGLGDCECDCECEDMLVLVLVRLENAPAVAVARDSSSEVEVSNEPGRLGLLGLKLELVVSEFCVNVAVATWLFASRDTSRSFKVL